MCFRRVSSTVWVIPSFGSGTCRRSWRKGLRRLSRREPSIPEDCCHMGPGDIICEPHSNLPRNTHAGRNLLGIYPDLRKPEMQLKIKTEASSSFNDDL
jgi:hypothetical protein